LLDHLDHLACLLEARFHPPLFKFNRVKSKQQLLFQEEVKLSVMFCAINYEESDNRNEELSKMVHETGPEDLGYYFTGNFCELTTRNGMNKSESKAKSHLSSLHSLIKKPSRDAAMKRLADFPQDAKVWVFWKNGRGKPVKYLPLHIACRETNKQKYQLVKLLIHIYPKAARTKDHAGRLPLHHLCLGALSSPTRR